MEHILHWIWLNSRLNLEMIRNIHGLYGDIDTIYKLTDYSRADFLSESDISGLYDKNLEDAREIYNSCMKLGIKIIVWDSTEYPPYLRHIYDPPVVLYARGVLPDWKSIFMIGVVGTRRMSEYGQSVTTRFVNDLLAAGVTPVTGFALGNDVIANRMATDKGMFSIALMGGGVDYIYPPQHWQLYNRMLEYGLFLSEYPPGTKPAAWNFPRRNRILSGLCRGVLVTEAPKKSGAIITAHLAADQGRDVFVIPGSINSLSSEGSNILIQEGAKAVVSAEDILVEYPEFLNRIKTQVAPVKATVPETEEKDIVLKLLSERDMTVDELCAKSGLSMTDCNSKCFMLELSGKIRRMPGNLYSKRNK